MIPHPTTWQADRERERQSLLASAERGHREANALAGTTNRWRADGSRNAGRWHAAGTAVTHAVRRPTFSRPRGEPRLVARLLSTFIATLLVLPITEGPLTTDD